MNTRVTQRVYLSAAVATGGTFTVGYPTGYNGGHFTGGVHHVITSSYGTMYAPATFTVSFANTLATVTYNGTTTLAAGTEVWVEFDLPGRTRTQLSNNALPDFVSECPMHIINLGAPLTADVDAVSTVQLIGDAGDFTITGAQASGGVATFDVPRNFTLTGATTNHTGVIFTVTGTDVYGNALVETLAGPSNNTVSGKKAFKTITTVSTDDAISTNGVSVGMGDVLGLPVHLPSAGCVIAELEDLAAATAGTPVAGTTAAVVSTATTADVRGTYDPNSACNGSKSFALIVALPNPDFLGNPQYAG